MSRDATAWVADHLGEVRRMTYQEGDKTRTLGENGLALLWYLCDRTNKAGVFFMTAETMTEEVGFSSVRVVRRLLAGMEQVGWITRTGEVVRYESRGKPTPEYALTLVPGLWKQRTGDPIGDHQVTQLVTHGSPKNAGKSSNGAKSSVSDVSEPEPQPEPQPHPERSQASRGAARGEGMEWGELHQQVLSGCVERESQTYKGHAGPGLIRKWHDDYRPLIAQAIREQPNADAQTLVTWCYATRNGLKEQKAPDRFPCADAIETAYCAGKRGDALRQAIGTYSQKAQQEVWDWFCKKYPDAQSPIDTPDRHTERVSPDEGANTDTPGPGDQADPRSVVRELPRIGRAV